MKYHVLLLLIAASALVVESSPGKSKSNTVQSKKHQTPLEAIPIETSKSNKPSEILPIIKKVGKPTRQSRQMNQIATKPRTVIKRPSRRDGNRRPVSVQYRPVVKQYRPRPVHIRQNANRPTVHHSGHRPVHSQHPGSHIKPVHSPVRTSVPVAQKTQQHQQASVVKPVTTVNPSNQDRFAGGRRL